MALSNTNVPITYTWPELAISDGAVTSDLFDCDGVITHKVIVKPCIEAALPNKYQLYTPLMFSYLAALLHVDIRPIENVFTRDKFTSFGCFAKELLPRNSMVPGLVGFLADFPIDEQDSCNEFSVYGGRKGEKLMLAGLSFVNSSCKPNCECVPDLKNNRMYIRVLGKSDIPAGTELTIRYNRGYFGDDNRGCECPYHEHHAGGSVEMVRILFNSHQTCFAKQYRVFCIGVLILLFN